MDIRPDKARQMKRNTILRGVYLVDTESSQVRTVESAILEVDFSIFYCNYWKRSFFERWSDLETLDQVLLLLFLDFIEYIKLKDIFVNSFWTRVKMDLIDEILNEISVVFEFY